MTSHAFLCDGIRTPFGRYGGALSAVRADDLAAVPLAALMARNPSVDWEAVTDVALTAVHRLHRGGGRYALCTMCIGVGQGVAVLLERV